MQRIKKGDFFGSHHHVIQFDNVVVTETEYTHDRVDWHYHENAYFTYLLNGELFEANRKQSYILDSGSLLYHNWQDPHYNEKRTDYSRGFHVEIEKKWFDRYELDNKVGEGSQLLIHPLIKGEFDQLYLETKINDSVSELSIHGILLRIFTLLKEKQDSYDPSNPDWIPVLKELLHDECAGNHSLTSLSKRLNIHPVHISRAFPRYFATTFGNYIRKLRLDKAAILLKDSNKTVTEIAYDCGFADQSHLIRCFKNFYGMTPLQYQKIVGHSKNSLC